MKKILVSIIFLLTAVVLTGCENATSASDNSAVGSDKSVTNNKIASEQPMSSAETVADKLEVYYFHRTARCYSCKTIGQFVGETMAEHYAGEIKSGKIDFREINVDEPENKEIARKFQATGSSLFINRIIDGQDNIEQDMNVWRLLGAEAMFKQYLEDKINTYLNI